MEHLSIDRDKCIGCGKCARMCMKSNIKIVDKKATEAGKGCIECGHCVSSCPKGAIKLLKSKESGPFSSIKKSKMFDGSLISDEDIETLCKSMKNDSHDIHIAIIQGEDLDMFMEEVWSILEKKESDLPIVKEWGEWRKKHDSLEPNPALWEGGQVLLIFASDATHALEASNRMMAKGLSLGIRGFHSNLIMLAYKADRDRILSNFTEISDELYMAYVIGHGRRLIEPAFKPLENVLNIFKR